MAALGHVISAGSSRLRVALVTDDFWSMSGARPVLGRLPASDERNVVVVSEPLYATRFADTIGALAMTRVMSSLLFQLKPTDPPTFVIAATVLALAAILASAVPAKGRPDGRPLLVRLKPDTTY